MPAAIIAGLGAAVAGGTGLASSLMQGKAARRDAEARKRSMDRYAKALSSEASKIQGGTSQAQQRTLATTGALQRSAESQHLLDQSKRGGRGPSTDDLRAVAQAQQAGAAAQQQNLDAMSQQQAVQRDEIRRSLQQQGLQAQAQAQAIDPRAAAAAARAPGLAQVGGAVGGAALQAAMPTLQQQVEGAATYREGLRETSDMQRAVDQGVKKSENKKVYGQYVRGTGSV